MREKRRHTVKAREHYVAQKAYPAGCLYISNDAIICQYRQFSPSCFPLMLVRTSSLPEDGALLAVPLLKHTTY